MTLKIDDNGNRIFELACSDCGEVGGTITFPENHGRESDEALQKELDAEYTHTCEQHTNKVL